MMSNQWNVAIAIKQPELSRSIDSIQTPKITFFAESQFTLKANDK